jgi:hypothetical protein
MLAIDSKRRSLLILLVVLLAAGAAGIYIARSHIGSGTTAFIVLRNAEGVQYVTFQGTRQMRYEFIEPYPAKAALKAISGQLKSSAWKPLQNSYLQPSRPSSHVTGWQEFQDASKTPWVNVRQWMAEWTNPKGDVVMYTLRYEWPNDGSPPNTSRAQLISVIIPAKAAASRRAEM